MAGFPPYSHGLPVCPLRRLFIVQAFLILITPANMYVKRYAWVGTRSPVLEQQRHTVARAWE